MADKRKYQLGPEEDGLIIHHPAAMSPTRRKMEWGLTVFGWVVWVFLCRPAIIAFLWVMGFEFFREHMIRLGGMSALVDFSFVYFAFVFALYIVIRGWNFYNARRFRGKDKRTMHKSIDPLDLEIYFRLPPGSISQVQNANSIDVKFFSDHCIELNMSQDKLQEHSYRGYFKPS